MVGTACRTVCTLVKIGSETISYTLLGHFTLSKVITVLAFDILSFRIFCVVILVIYGGSYDMYNDKVTFLVFGASETIILNTMFYFKF